MNCHEYIVNVTTPHYDALIYPSIVKNGIIINVKIYTGGYKYCDILYSLKLNS